VSTPMTNRQYFFFVVKILVLPGLTIALGIIGVISSGFLQVGAFALGFALCCAQIVLAIVRRANRPNQS
jgi:hypothetical protein